MTQQHPHSGHGGGGNAYPLAGEVIDGKYQVERMIGEGGMGAVAKAFHLLRRAPVALKFMNPQFVTFPGAVQRFINEAVAASQIDSDHAVVIYDVGKLTTGAPYLVMEYMEGLDLADLLARDGRPGLPVDRVIHFMAQILRGLQVAHAAGVIHRDMKPSNCFIVRRDGEDDFVKLLDFGISKVQQPGSGSLTQTNSALGTPLYMSPEQAKSPRDVDLRSDIYSVGVIFYELLSGRTPFFSESGEFTEILFKLFTQDPDPIASLRPDLPPELAAVVHRALAREPDERYSTVQDLAEALEPFASPRTMPLLDRIRKYLPGERTTSLGSIVPVAAFDQLPTHHQLATGAFANQPPTQGAHTIPQASAAYPHSSVQPPSIDARASQAEAVAATQFSSSGVSPDAPRVGPSAASTAASAQIGAPHVAMHSAPPPPEPRTDLGAVTDTQQAVRAQMRLAPKRPPIAWLLVAPVVLLAAGATFVATRGSKSNSVTPAATITAEIPTVHAIPPPPTASAEMHATNIAPPPSAAPSASAIPSAAPPKAISTPKNSGDVTRAPPQNSKLNIPFKN